MWETFKLLIKAKTNQSETQFKNKNKLYVASGEFYEIVYNTKKNRKKFQLQTEKYA